MTEAAVVFNEVSKFYGEVLGVNRVTLNIPPGITSLVGPNGSGKTTLLDILTGAGEPDAGTVRLGERPLHIRSPRDAIRVFYGTGLDMAILGSLVLRK